MIFKVKKTKANIVKAAKGMKSFVKDPKKAFKNFAKKSKIRIKGKFKKRKYTSSLASMLYSFSFKEQAISNDI